MENFVVDVRNIYKCLGDNKSRDIFGNRLLFWLTGDFQYVSHMVSPILIDALSEKLEKVSLEQEIIIHAPIETNMFTDIILDAFSKRITCLCDHKRAGTVYKEHEIISLEEVFVRHSDAMLIVIVFAEELMKMTREFLGNDNVIAASEIMQMCQQEQYFPEDVIALEDGEVFVDVGCYEFDTSEILLQKCKPKKIYAFEPDALNYMKITEKIKERKISEVELFQKGAWNQAQTLYFDMQSQGMSQIASNGDVKIDVVALDEVIQECVTYIKMDIEGVELEALKGSKGLIQKYKPKLAICIYHKLEDIISIPQYIQSLVPEYKFYIRQHGFACTTLGAVETVLYAVV